MIEGKRELGFIGGGEIQSKIDGANQLETKEFLSGIINGTIREKVAEVKAKKVEIREKNNPNQNDRPDFSDLLDI